MDKLIALLTDFGLKDGFVGTVKGVIKSINPKADIIDISHDVSSFDILEASIILNASYKYFPKKTIFVCVVDPGVGTDRRPILVETENYYFIAPDNGLLTLPLQKQRIKKIIHLTNEKYFLRRNTETFHGRDIFAPVAAYLSKGIPVEKFGQEIKNINQIDFPWPYKEDNKIIGQIIKFDKFGNAITNLEYIPESFKEIKLKDYKITKICRNFQEGEKDKPNVIKGSFGFYEIFVPEDSAREILGLTIGDKVEVFL